LTATEIAESLSARLDTSAPELATLDSYYAGTQSAAFLSAEARDALGDRFKSLSVNFPRLVVDAKAERLQVTGFRLSGPDSPADDDLWRIWRRNGMIEGSAQAHTEALALKRAFVIVWAGPDERTPRITVESARQVAVQRSPLTREVTAAIKRWTEDGRAHVVVYERDKITRLRSKARVAADSAIPASGWDTVEVIDNPLGVVPVVPLVNRGRLLDVDGVSEMADVLDLADAINKITADMLVTSEFYARPRRWVTGLEVVEDEEGNVVNPFASEAGRVWQSEAPETKFGQFDAARLDGYADALATLTQQIGALSGLPPHYLGLHGDQPASADAIRSAEASLVATAHARQRTFGAAWADVMRLVIAVRDGIDARTVEVETVWADAETRTPAQAADAAAKLASIGVPLTAVMENTLGYSPAQISRVRELRRSEALDAALAGDLSAVMP
jgi:hypothetical protein